MLPGVSFREISLSQVLVEDHTFYLPSLVDQSQTETLDNLLFNPVRLQTIADGRFRIIDGFRVVNRLGQKKGYRTIPALLYTAQHSPLDLWKFRIEKRLRENNFPIYSILTNLVTHFDFDQIQSDSDMVAIFKRAKVPLGKIKRSLHIKLSPLVSKINNFSNIDHLGIKEMLLLAEFSIDEINALNTLFAGQTLKGNKLLSMLRIIIELKNGYDIALQEILKDSEINSIIQESADNQKYRLLKSRLTILRFPILDKLTKDWRKSRSKIDLPAQVHVTHDPSFESDTLTFTVEIESTEKFKTVIKQLEAQLSKGDLDQLFEFV